MSTRHARLHSSREASPRALFAFPPSKCLQTEDRLSAQEATTSSSIDSIGRARDPSCCTGLHRLAKGSTGSAVRTDPDDVLARCFGGDEGSIGVIDELIAGRSLGEHSHADAHRHRSRIILEAPLDSGTNAFGDLLCDDNRCAGHDDDKLFSVEAGANIENPHAGMKDVGDLSQRAITFEMSARVIDPLEIVDVDQQQCQIVFLPPGPFHLYVESGLEISSV